MAERLIKVVYPDQLVSRDYPENYDLADKEYFYKEDFNYRVNNLHYIEIVNASVVYHCVFEKLSIATTYCLHRPLSQLQVLRQYSKLLLYRSRKIDRAFLYVNEWGTNYFHWLTELFPIIVATTNERNQYDGIIPHYYLRYAFIREGLEMFGLQLNTYQSREKLVINKLRVCNQAQVGQYNIELLSMFKRQIIGKIETENGIRRRIYVSRKMAHSRKILNEDSVIELLTEFKFQVIHFENLKFYDQVKLMMESDFLISSHGAGLTNLMFMKTNSMVLELKAINNDFNCYFTLARVFNIKYYYQRCVSDDPNHRLANISVDLVELRKNIMLAISSTFNP
jgi:capsular polysaccharide biosynthesis protein